jgi:hypothetical protein
MNNDEIEKKIKKYIYKFKDSSDSYKKNIYKEKIKYYRSILSEQTGGLLLKDSASLPAEIFSYLNNIIDDKDNKWYSKFPETTYKRNEIKEKINSFKNEYYTSNDAKIVFANADTDKYIKDLNILMNDINIYKNNLVSIFEGYEKIKKESILNKIDFSIKNIKDNQAKLNKKLLEDNNKKRLESKKNQEIENKRKQSLAKEGEKILNNMADYIIKNYALEPNTYAMIEKYNNEERKTILYLINKKNKDFFKIKNKNIEKIYKVLTENKNIKK